MRRSVGSAALARIVPPDHQHPVSRLPEESYSCTHQQVGRASEPILGWRPHQVLVVQDSVPIVERKRFPCRSVHRSGSITFSLEEHDCGRTETARPDLDPLVNSGGKGIRTPGLLIANETLYQLSYTPEIFEEAPFKVQNLVCISTGDPPVLPP